MGGDANGSRLVTSARKVPRGVPLARVVVPHEEEVVRVAPEAELIAQRRRQVGAVESEADAAVLGVVGA